MPATTTSDAERHFPYRFQSCGMLWDIIPRAGGHVIQHVHSGRVISPEPHDSLADAQRWFMLEANPAALSVDP